jgi:uncharacterized protein (DUF488 family)
MRQSRRKEPRLVFTIGHSTRARKDFLRLLRAHGVRELADVRTIPRSRHNPQFNRGELARALRRAGIRYEHMPELGGLRRPKPDSVNTAWRNASFRGFADYMQTPEFEEAIERLAREARRRRVAVMCAEAVPWRCHRSLIADALIARGFSVEEIESPTRARPRALTPWARVKGRRVQYPLPTRPSRAARLARRRERTGKGG